MTNNYYNDKVSLCSCWMTMILLIFSIHSDHYSVSSFVIRQPSISEITTMSTPTISYFNNAVHARHNTNDQRRQQQKQRSHKKGLSQLNVIPHDLLLSSSDLVSSSSSSLSSISSSIQHTIGILLPDIFASSLSSSSSSSTIILSTSSSTTIHLPNLLISYTTLLQTYPISTKTITASILACIGDAIAQYRAYQQLEKQHYISYQQEQQEQLQQQLQSQVQQLQQQQLLYSSSTNNAVTCQTCDDNNDQCDHNDDNDDTRSSLLRNNQNSNSNTYQPLLMMDSSNNNNGNSRNSGGVFDRKGWSPLTTRMNAFHPSRNSNNNNYDYNNNNAVMSFTTRLSSSFSNHIENRNTMNIHNNNMNNNNHHYQPLLYQYDITRGIVFLLFGAIYTGLFQHYWFTYMSNHISYWGQQLGIWDQAYKTGNTFSIQVLRAILDGTRQHEWFTCFDIKLHMELPPSPLAIAIGKVMVNQFIVVPILYMPLFFTLTNIVAKLNMKQSIERIQLLYFPILFRNYIFWLPVQLIQFLLIPTEWQIPLQAVASLVWTIILSSSTSTVSTSSSNNAALITTVGESTANVVLDQQQPFSVIQGTESVFTTTSSETMTRNVQILQQQQQQVSDVFASSQQQSQQQQASDGDNSVTTATTTATTTTTTNLKTTNEILDDVRIKDVIPERVLDTMKEVFVDNKVGIASSGFAFGLLSAAADDAMLGTAVGSMMGTEASVGVAIMSAVGAGVSIWSANANAAYNNANAAVAAKGIVTTNAVAEEEQQPQLILVPNDDDGDTTSTTDNSNGKRIIDPMIEMQKVINHVKEGSNHTLLSQEEEIISNTLLYKNNERSNDFVKDETSVTVVDDHDDLDDVVSNDELDDFVSNDDVEILKMNQRNVITMHSATLTANDSMNHNTIGKEEDIHSDSENYHTSTTSNGIAPTIVSISSSNVLKTISNDNLNE